MAPTHPGIIIALSIISMVLGILASFLIPGTRAIHRIIISAACATASVVIFIFARHTGDLMAGGFLAGIALGRLGIIRVF